MRVVVGVTGASGQIYARILINKLRSIEGVGNKVVKPGTETGIGIGTGIGSDTGTGIWTVTGSEIGSGTGTGISTEIGTGIGIGTGNEIRTRIGTDAGVKPEVDIIFTDTALKVYTDETGEQPPIPLLDNNSYYNRNASGSNCADVMIIIPCTMGTAGRIASGITTDLISRIAEVQLKERKKLIICPRETPLSLIHLRNLTALTEAGAIIAPASPSFYSHPSDLNELAINFADRILQLAGIKPLDDKYRWG